MQLIPEQGNTDLLPDSVNITLRSWPTCCVNSKCSISWQLSVSQTVRHHQHRYQIKGPQPDQASVLILIWGQAKHTSRPRHCSIQSVLEAAKVELYSSCLAVLPILFSYNTICVQPMRPRLNFSNRMTLPDLGWQLQIPCDVHRGRLAQQLLQSNRRRHDPSHLLIHCFRPCCCCFLQER